MSSIIGTILAKGQNDNGYHYRSILILILTIIGLFDYDFHSQQQKRTKKDGQKMTDYQKSFGGTRRF